MFSWLKGVFRKKEDKREPAEERQAEDIVSIREEIKKEDAPKEEKKEERQKGEPDRPERKCPKCGAPNDTFVSICWLCKEPI